MAHRIANMVKQTSRSAGPAIALTGAAVRPYRKFETVLEPGDTTEAMVIDRASGQWQAGVATYDGTALTFDAEHFFDSSSGTPVPFGTGLKDVKISPLAEKGKAFRRSGNFNALPYTYDVDTSDGPITATLAADADEGAVIVFNDFAGTWGGNPLTITGTYIDDGSGTLRTTVVVTASGLVTLTRARGTWRLRGMIQPFGLYSPVYQGVRTDPIVIHVDSSASDFNLGTSPELAVASYQRALDLCQLQASGSPGPFTIQGRAGDTITVPAELRFDSWKLVSSPVTFVGAITDGEIDFIVQGSATPLYGAAGRHDLASATRGCRFFFRDMLVQRFANPFSASQDSGVYCTNVDMKNCQVGASSGNGGFVDISILDWDFRDDAGVVIPDSIGLRCVIGSCYDLTQPAVGVGHIHHVARAVVLSEAVSGHCDRLDISDVLMGFDLKRGCGCPNLSFVRVWRASYAAIRAENIWALVVSNNMDLGQDVAATSTASALSSVTTGTGTELDPYITTTTLTWGGSLTGTLLLGQTLVGANVPDQVRVLSQLSGSPGGAGTYAVTPVENLAVSAQAISADNSCAVDILLTVAGTGSTVADLNDDPRPRFNRQAGIGGAITNTTAERDFYIPFSIVRGAPRDGDWMDFNVQGICGDGNTGLSQPATLKLYLGATVIATITVPANTGYFQVTEGIMSIGRKDVYGLLMFGAGSGTSPFGAPVPIVISTTAGKNTISKTDPTKVRWTVQLGTASDSIQLRKARVDFSYARVTYEQ